MVCKCGPRQYNDILIQRESISRWVIVSSINSRIWLPTLNPFNDMPILGSSDSAANKDMLSKIWKMGIQLSDRVENIVGKGEIARNEQYLLFSQCFQKLSSVDTSK